MPWDAPGSIPVVTIKVEKTSKTSAEKMNSVPVKHLGHEPLLEYALVRESGRSFVVVKLLPFIKKGTER